MHAEAKIDMTKSVGLGCGNVSKISTIKPQTMITTKRINHYIATSSNVNSSLLIVKPISTNSLISSSSSSITTNTSSIPSVKMTTRIYSTKTVNGVPLKCKVAQISKNSHEKGQVLHAPPLSCFSRRHIKPIRVNGITNNSLPVFKFITDDDDNNNIILKQGTQ
ncbi:hypothetical protein BLOT_011951 [Blomia tropicalis]|nr:hypothetical protein BLOT_011951 [Blomia tropicalis]